MFSCPITCSVAVSKRTWPDRIRAPSSEIDRAVDVPARDRDRNTVRERVSYTNTLGFPPPVGMLTPAMEERSRVAVSWLRTVRDGRLFGGGSIGEAGAGRATLIFVSDTAAVGDGSYSSRTLPPPGLPTVVINTRPSAPTATA